MTFQAYDNSVPATADKPKQDQPIMLVNAKSIPNIIAVDHFQFNDNQGGYHKVIHQPIQGDPAAIAGINELYSKSYTPDTTGGIPDTQLFTRTGLGGISQMSGSSTAITSDSDGWSWSGGILHQWGKVNQSFSAGSTVGAVTFKDRVANAIPFPNNCFVVIASNRIASGSLPNSQGSINVLRSSVNKLGFDWQFYTNSADYKGFYWYAVGN